MDARRIAYITMDVGTDHKVAVLDLKTLEVTGRIEIPAGPPTPCAGACDTMALAWTGR